MTFQETFARRSDLKKTMEANSDRMVSGLLKSFPYLDVGQFLFEELRLILNKSPWEMDCLLHDANTVMETLAEMVPAAQLKRQASSHASHITVEEIVPLCAPLCAPLCMLLRGSSVPNFVTLFTLCDHVPIYGHLFSVDVSPCTRLCLYTGTEADCRHLDIRLQGDCWSCKEEPKEHADRGEDGRA